MKTVKFTYWQDGSYYLGFLNDYPDYQTQGMSKEELISNLKSLLADMASGAPYSKDGRAGCGGRKRRRLSNALIQARRRLFPSIASRSNWLIRVW